MPKLSTHALLATLFATLIAAAAGARDAYAATAWEGSDALRLRGRITSGDVCRVAEALTGDRTLKRVIVDSTGGDAWAGARIGRLLGWAGVEAVVEPGAQALSAAAVVVFGAPQRTVKGRIGFHAPFEESGRTDTITRTTLMEVNREVRSVLVLGGMPTFFIEKAMSTGRNNLFVMDGAMIESYRHRGGINRDKLASTAAACRRLSVLATP